MDTASTDVKKPPRKPRTRTTPQQRKPVVAALLANGMTQTDIAKELGVDRSVIVADVAEIRPSVDQARTILQRMQARIAEILPPETRVDRYAEMLDLARDTKQPSAGVQILARLDSLDGVITDTDRMRSKANDPAPVVPMFALPAGSMVSVTVTTPQHIEDAAQGGRGERVIEAEVVESKDSAE